MKFDDFVEILRNKLKEEVDNKRISLYQISSSLYRGILPVKRLLSGGSPSIKYVEKWFESIGYDVHIVLVPKGESVSDETIYEAINELISKIGSGQRKSIDNTIANIVNSDDLEDIISKLDKNLGNNEVE